METNNAKAAARLARTAFRDHAVDLQRFLIRRVNHAHDADDLGQEVFARLLRVPAQA
jgi:DNA-directed RNA polymerase specialized sigma24 family protein